VEEVLGGGPLADRLRDGIEELDDQVDGLRGRFVEDEEQAPIGDPGLAGRRTCGYAGPRWIPAPGSRGGTVRERT
jgi:hypothetical protein